MRHRLSEVGAAAPGRAWPLGAEPDSTGVNFAVFSAHAERIELCLFSPAGRETARIPFRERTGDIWHLHVPGLGPGALYGLRAHGPWAPREGHRFNPAKLLLDPYARAWSGGVAPHPVLCGHEGEDPISSSPDGRDSAPFMPRCVVTGDDGYDWQGDAPPEVPWERTLLYEAHPKGLTMTLPGVPERDRGRFAGLASPAVIDHLCGLGVTALELLPVAAFVDEPALLRRGLSNYWGYNPVGLFLPDARYCSPDEFRTMVRRLHAAGVEVILDIVLNHTGEGDAAGPTLSFRGLDNASYYWRDPGTGVYLDHTGCGNALDLSHPAAQRLALDTLRFWVEAMHVDGFRFDLATTLAREDGGFDPGAGFLDALRQDPVLARVKLIAEPWDIGPGGYRPGAFPAPFAEWNDRFRDTARRFWRGDSGQAGALAAGLLGSADRFDHGGRRATTSVNHITAHDGFTLADLVAFAERHNEGNGEGNRDGAAENWSANGGIEGATDDPEILALRDRRRRALMATLLLAQGTPMLLAGDEAGNGQGGNNNAYCQDNPTGWVDWAGLGAPFAGFVRRLAALRRRYPVLSQGRFLHGQARAADGLPDVAWSGADGALPDWHDPLLRRITLLLRGAADGEEGLDPVLVLVNGGAAARFVLPPAPPGRHWRAVLDTSAADGVPGPGRAGREIAVAEGSVLLLAPGARE